MTDLEGIWVFGLEDSEGDRGFYEVLDRLSYGRNKVDLGRLQSQLDSFLTKIRLILERLDAQAGFGEFSLDEVVLAVEVSASGTVSLLGIGGGGSGKGGLTFKFKRRQRHPGE